jgi:hypothetical protein
MDYSASINDADNPVGASPWGNSPESSPRPNRTTFGALGNEAAPVPPFPFAPQTGNNGLGAEPEEGGFGAGDTNYNRPDTASTVSGTETTADAGPDLAGAPPAKSGQQETPQQERSQVPPKQPGQHAPQAREQQVRRPQQSQYKLQAKITGLERAGRKDPILRFDVHVGEQITPSFGAQPADKKDRQTCLISERLSIEMSADSIPSLLSSPNT